MKIPCGKCFACLQRYKMSWANRLIEHSRSFQNKYFCDLTYDELSLPVINTDTNVIKPFSSYIGNSALHLSDTDYDNLYPTLDKEEVVRFIKRFRKRFPFKFSYWLCGEYGEHFDRPHYHFLLFIHDNTITVSRDDISSFIAETWQHGYNTVFPVSDKDIRYTCKYSLKQQMDEKSNVQKPFMLCSKGIGKNYLELYETFSFHDDSVERVYYPLNRKTKSYMPRYWRDVLFSEQTRKEYSDMIQQQENNKTYDKFISDYKRDEFTQYIASRKMKEQLISKKIPKKLI